MHPRNTDKNGQHRLIAEKLEWVEERARLQHNLQSLQTLLEEREARAIAEENASAYHLKTAREEGDRFKREAISLRETADSLNAELAEALSAVAEKQSSVVITPVTDTIESTEDEQHAAHKEDEGLGVTGDDALGGVGDGEDQRPIISEGAGGGVDGERREDGVCIQKEAGLRRGGGESIGEVKGVCERHGEGAAHVAVGDGGNGTGRPGSDADLDPTRFGVVYSGPDGELEGRHPGFDDDLEGGTCECSFRTGTKSKTVPYS